MALQTAPNSKIMSITKLQEFHKKLVIDEKKG